MKRFRTRLLLAAALTLSPTAMTIADADEPQPPAAEATIDQDAIAQAIADSLQQTDLPADVREIIRSRLLEAIHHTTLPATKDQVETSKPTASLAIQGNVTSQAATDQDDKMHRFRAESKDGRVEVKITSANHLPASVLRQLADFAGQLEAIPIVEIGSPRVRLTIRDGRPLFEIGISVEHILTKTNSPEASSESSTAEDKSPVVVTELYENSPAAETGLKVGDRIRLVNGQPATAEKLVEAIQIAGDTAEEIELQWTREGEEYLGKLKPRLRSVVLDDSSSGLRAELRSILRERVKRTVPQPSTPASPGTAADSDDSVNQRLQRLEQQLTETHQDLSEIKELLRRQLKD